MQCSFDDDDDEPHVIEGSSDNMGLFLVIFSFILLTRLKGDTFKSSRYPDRCFAVYLFRLLATGEHGS